MDRRAFVRLVGGSAAAQTSGLTSGLRVLAQATSSQRRDFEYPFILPLPSETCGVQQCVHQLDGRWTINAAPVGEFWREGVPAGTWQDVIVPGQADRQGVSIARGKRYAYRTSFEVPGDFTGKRIVLRFESVSGTAELWVNGASLEGHRGGFRYMDMMDVEAYYHVMHDLPPDLSTDPDIPRLMRDVVEGGGRGFYQYSREEAKAWEEQFLAFNYEMRRLTDRYTAPLPKAAPPGDENEVIQEAGDVHRQLAL